MSSKPLARCALDDMNPPSLRSHVTLNFPAYVLGAVFQSHLKCCLPGSSPNFAPRKLNSQLSHCTFFFFFQITREKCQALPANSHKLGRGKDEFPSRCQRESDPANILISDFWPPELWDHKFLLF